MNVKQKDDDLKARLDMVIEKSNAKNRLLKKILAQLNKDSKEAGNQQEIPSPEKK